ncbi:hypothetical protein BDM02DRAFT_580926 [Thelephora ganbajun]|uniref:Uncharacterized protein n=1 Tax=Thelephora ganbajun TaxID=370292 RepID=A0ACB6Z7M8_THEGA|nr:hypothetical protein BDM02DRAFT_580926 [Thelephora ganbajun]
MELNAVDFEDPFAFDATTLSKDDLHLRFRLIFISYRYKVGLCGPSSKHRAIILGDKSGTFVHPFYVDFAHLFGCLIYQRKSFNQSFQHLEAGFFKIALESLANVRESEDPFTYAQAYWFMAYGYLTRPHYPLAEKYLESCVRAVEGNPVAFLPHLIRTEGLGNVEISEQSQDRLAFLASLIYYRALLRTRVHDAESGEPPEEAVSWLSPRSHTTLSGSSAY